MTRYHIIHDRLTTDNDNNNNDDNNNDNNDNNKEINNDKNENLKNEYENLKNLEIIRKLSNTSMNSNNSLPIQTQTQTQTQTPLETLNKISSSSVSRSGSILSNESKSPDENQLTTFLKNKQLIPSSWSTPLSNLLPYTVDIQFINESETEEWRSILTKLIVSFGYFMLSITLTSITMVVCHEKLPDEFPPLPGKVFIFILFFSLSLFFISFNHSFSFFYLFIYLFVCCCFCFMEKKKKRYIS
jgi:hypothetical protein